MIGCIVGICIHDLLRMCAALSITLTLVGLEAPQLINSAIVCRVILTVQCGMPQTQHLDHNNWRLIDGGLGEGVRN
jgi:hypothetical protein